MALCPECSSEMGQTEVVCPECGFDFPDEPTRPNKSGLAHSPLADIALVVGGVAAGLASVASIFGGIVAAMHGDFWNGLVVAPISFFLCLAMLVVFVRIQELSSGE